MQNPRFRPFSRLWLLCLLGGLLGILGIAFWQPGKAYSRQELSFSVAEGRRQIQASVFRPSQVPQGALPGVVLVHGVLVQREYMAFWARSLARQGVVTLIFDLGGYGESDPRPESESDNLQETLAAIGQLRQLPGVDNDRIAVVGHSMGGTAVLQALAADSRLRGGLVVGMQPESGQMLPCRVWLGLGQYEAFHPPAQIRAQWPAEQRGCERRLFVSPVASHQTEMRDPLLVMAASSWLSQQFETAAAPNAVWSEVGLSLASELYGLAWLGLALLLLWNLSQSWGALILLSASLGGLLVAGQLRWLPPAQAALLCVGTLAVITLRSHLHDRQSLSWSQTLALAACLWLGHQGVALVHALPALLQNPVGWLWLPFFLVQELRVLPQTGVEMLQGLFFLRYSQTLEPAWPVGALLALEWMLPGRLAGYVLQSGPWLSARLNQPLQQRPSSGLRALAVLLGLSGVLGLMLWQRAESGFLHAGALNLFWQHGILRLLPMLLLALGLYRLYLQKWGQKMITRPRQDSNLRPTI